MDNKFLKHLKNNISLFLLCFCLSSCSTLHSNYMAQDNQVGYAYSGITMDAYAIKCLWKMPGIANEKDDTPYYQSIPVALLGSVYFIIDIPFSIVGDTLNLSVDLTSEPKNERWTLSKKCGPKD